MNRPDASAPFTTPGECRPLIIFDLDDTLVATGPCYETVIAAFVSFLQSQLTTARSVEEIRGAQERIDADFAHRNVRAHVFAPERFPDSFVETYRHFCRLEGNVPDPAAQRRCAELGWSVYDARPDLLPGAIEALEALRSRAELRMYTLGVEEIQRPKIDAHGLDRFFDAIHIVPAKNVEALRGVMNGRDRSEVAIVGDSIRFEINPALELGIFAVHLRHQTEWKYAQPEPLSRDYCEVTALREAQAVLEDRFLAREREGAA